MTCPVCHGSGERTYVAMNRQGQYDPQDAVDGECDRCRGTGEAR